ncbi:hypothetical protein EDC01DRAFT_636804 [Geopyxis carbonaria]|nr:hypothetical protein EDC01DRAFT_636804 [Geopyxis carbonaria]
MKFTHALLLIAAVGAHARPAPAEESATAIEATSTVLTEAEVQEFPMVQFDDDAAASTVSRRSADNGPTCKYLPGDSKWPSNSAWKTLDRFVTGPVASPSPLASPCYTSSGVYNAATCASITSNWGDSNLHINHETSIMSALFQGMTCLPTDDPTGTCSVGGYPVRVVNAQNARDVQAAVNFARNANVRLVVKNTGHDFAGKSSGAGALSIRTHAMKEIKFLESFQGGPAMVVGAGVQGGELYAAANEHGVVAVGGEGMTVGWGGGYVQGGGHSPLSSLYGLAADHVLAFEVVLASGRLVTASATENSDLFWALRGGGGSTFGVVISTTVRVYPDLPVTVAGFSFSASPSDVAGINDDFWSVVKAYHQLFADHADRGIYSYFNIFGGATPTFSMVPFFAPRHSAVQVRALLKPVLDAAEAVNITIKGLEVTEHPGFHAAWAAGFPKEVVGTWNGQLGSRLFPRSNWEDDAAFDAMFSAIRAQATSTYLIGFNMAPRAPAGVSNAANPAWRNALMHAITGAFWDPALRDMDQIEAMRKTFTEVAMQKWRDVSPGSGAYLGEADINEPDRQQAFWGTNYDRLKGIKERRDPKGVFFAETAVGSEDWTTGADRLGRLCRV